MAKLYFFYGTVSSSKTLNLLAGVHVYKKQNKRVLLFKPKIDVRFGRNKVKSRAGLERDVDLLLDSVKDLNKINFYGIEAIFVDEAQFLNTEIIDKLRDLTVIYNIPILCYGLRTDFKGKLFKGSKRLMELADTITEIKSICTYCHRKAILNLKSIDGIPTNKGKIISLGCEELYLPVCFSCYKKKLNIKTKEQK